MPQAMQANSFRRVPLLSFRPSEAVSRARGEIWAHSARQKVVYRALQSDFSTALEMTGHYISTHCKRGFISRVKQFPTKIKNSLHGALLHDVNDFTGRFSAQHYRIKKPNKEKVRKNFLQRDGSAVPFFKPCALNNTQCTTKNCSSPHSWSAAPG